MIMTLIITSLSKVTIYHHLATNDKIRKIFLNYFGSYFKLINYQDASAYASSFFHVWEVPVADNGKYPFDHISHCSYSSVKIT